eukprot:2992550-Prymnesium_polylepis.1
MTDTASAPAAAEPESVAAAPSADAAEAPAGFAASGLMGEHQQQMAEAAASEMLQKIAHYIAGETDLSLEDYRLLQSMNLAAADRYGEMADYSSGLVAFAERLQAKCDAMLPHLSRVRVPPPPLAGTAALQGGAAVLSDPRCAPARDTQVDDLEQQCSSWTNTRVAWKPNSRSSCRERQGALVQRRSGVELVVSVCPHPCPCAVPCSRAQAHSALQWTSTITQCAKAPRPLPASPLPPSPERTLRTDRPSIVFGMYTSVVSQSLHSIGGTHTRTWSRDLECVLSTIRLQLYFIKI